jgi:hypothetical protein
VYKDENQKIESIGGRSSQLFKIGGRQACCRRRNSRASRQGLLGGIKRKNTRTVCAWHRVGGI